MTELKVWLHPSSADDDEDLFFAELECTTEGKVATLLELYLKGVKKSEVGEKRVRKASVIARIWIDEGVYRDFPYDDIIAAIEAAKRSLHEDEMSRYPA